jgi:thymidine phosphorylase
MTQKTFLPQELIRKKALNGFLSHDEIHFLVQGIADGKMGDAQVGALAMAIFLIGLSPEETSSLTLNMRDSGQVLKWDLPGPILDKHSTGGVGDLVSLVMGPMVAASGAFVPMISGRGLGHTGGTLDKLESIPGFRTSLRIDDFQNAVKINGCAIVGQTDTLAPADKRLYSIRDITGTVASIPLITASILSKKLAAGLQGLCMDVKTGNGAFMENIEGSLELAKTIAEVCSLAGVPISSVVSDMTQPLASSAGNALEVAYAVEYLIGKKREPRFHALVMKLSSELLMLGGISEDEPSALIKLQETLNSGKATEIFQKMVVMQGGSPNFVENYKTELKFASFQAPIIAAQTGYISAIETREIGLKIVELGGGRRQPSDSVNYRVGITEIAEIGQKVKSGDVLGVVWAESKKEAESIAFSSKDCFQIGDHPTLAPNLIRASFLR